MWIKIQENSGKSLGNKIREKSGNKNLGKNPGKYLGGKQEQKNGEQIREQNETNDKAKKDTVDLLLDQKHILKCLLLKVFDQKY